VLSEGAFESPPQDSINSPAIKPAHSVGQMLASIATVLQASATLVRLANDILHLRLLILSAVR
jgi:hypothetical protein